MRKNALKIVENSSINKQCSFVQQKFTNLFSDKNLNALARKHSFIKRSRKITAPSFVKALIFSEENNKDISLLDIKCDLFEHDHCQISQEAIHKRFTNEAVSFLKDLFSQMLSNHFNYQKQSVFNNSFFTSINIKDSSKFKLPISFLESYPSYGSFNKSFALMNIQFEFDLLTGNWRNLELTKATRNDQTDSKETIDNIEQGSLNIRDLGYITTTYLKGVQNNNAYYLNRLPKIGVCQKVENKFIAIDWQALDKKMKEGKFNYLEQEVYLGKNNKIKSRMILAPVPQTVTNERIRKAKQGGKRTKGYQISKEYKIKARYNIYITNVPEQIMPAEEVINSYKLRWQIELIFKTWKSNLNIHKMKPMKKERMECQLIAKLIWILLNSQLLQIANYALKSTDVELGCSPTKFFKRAKKFSQTLRYVIDNIKTFLHWFKTSVIPIIPSLIIEKRLKKETHCQILSRINAG